MPGGNDERADFQSCLRGSLNTAFPVAPLRLPSSAPGGERAATAASSPRSIRSDPTQSMPNEARPEASDRFSSAVRAQRRAFLSRGEPSPGQSLVHVSWVKTVAWSRQAVR